MKVSHVKELFRKLTQSYFAGASVIYGRQSRVAKTDVPLISLTAGNVRRFTNPVYKMVDGELVGSYGSRLAVTVDLFTKGAPVKDDDTGETIAFENTAMDDILDFADFLGSQYVVEWCHRNDLSVLIDGEAQDMTGLVNDNNYDFRSRLNVMIYFTQHTVGSTAVLEEGSILYPTGDNDEAGNPTYSPKEPVSTESTTGTYPGLEKENAIIKPDFKQNPSGGGSEELAELEVGYFTEVEIKEETGNE